TMHTRVRPPRVLAITVGRLMYCVVHLMAIQALGQTITVDVSPSHVVNSFSPPHAFVAGVDRIAGDASNPLFQVPAEVTDALYQPRMAQRLLEAGWGTGSSREITGRLGQGWRWNSKRC